MRISRVRPAFGLGVAAALGLLTVLLAVTPSASAAADTTSPRVTLDGGMFIKVGSVMSSSDLQTATLPMNITWSASDIVGIVSQTASLSAAVSDDGPFLPYQEKQLGGAARQATFTNFAHESNADTTGGVRVYAAAGNETDGSWAYNTDYFEAENLTLGGSWTRATCNCWMGGDVLKSTQVGASATFTMGGNDYCSTNTPGHIGDSVGVIGDLASTRGTAKVYVDGKLVTTISEKGSTANRVVIFQKRYKGFTPATHTVKIVVASGRFDLDGIERADAWDFHGCGG